MDFRGVIALLVALQAADPLSVTPAVAKMLELNKRLEAAYERKLATGRSQPIRFRLTESEVNEYLAWTLKTEPRPGVESIRLKFLASNYISSSSIVNFDEVERWRPGTIPMLLQPLLRGNRAIQVDLRFQVKSGNATFQVEKAYLEKLRLPAVVVERVIEIVAAQQPEKYDTTRPLPLAFGLRRVWTEAQILAGEN